jgi:hypothetical protein
MISFSLSVRLSPSFCSLFTLSFAFRFSLGQFSMCRLLYFLELCPFSTVHFFQATQSGLDASLPSNRLIYHSHILLSTSRRRTTNAILRQVIITMTKMTSRLALRPTTTQAGAGRTMTKTRTEMRRALMTTRKIQKSRRHQMMSLPLVPIGMLSRAAFFAASIDPKQEHLSLSIILYV